MEWLLSLSLVIITILFVILIVFVRKTTVTQFLINLLAGILLVWKIIEFSYYGITNSHIYPVEISHISYFVCGIIVLSQSKRLYFSAGCLAFFSGLGYLVMGLVSPKGLIASHGLAIIIMGFISHMMLLLLGMLLLFDFKKYSYKDLIGLGIIFVLVIAYVSLIIYKVIFKDLGSPNAWVSIMLVSGRILEYVGVSPDNVALNWSVTILAYIIFFGVCTLLNFINHKIFDRHKKTEAN